MTKLTGTGPNIIRRMMGREQISEKKVEVLLMTRLMLAEYNKSINTICTRTYKEYIYLATK